MLQPETAAKGDDSLESKPPQKQSSYLSILGQKTAAKGDDSLESKPP
jgi:hypothetical protein